MSSHQEVCLGECCDSIGEMAGQRNKRVAVEAGFNLSCDGRELFVVESLGAYHSSEMVFG